MTFEIGVAMHKIRYDDAPAGNKTHFMYVYCAKYVLLPAGASSYLMHGYTNFKCHYRIEHSQVSTKALWNKHSIPRLVCSLNLQT